MHRALADFAGQRANSMGVDSWRRCSNRCGPDLDAIRPGLFDARRLRRSTRIARWPPICRPGAIHADLFPDNVLMLGDRVTGLIDFYFACTDSAPTIWR